MKYKEQKYLVLKIIDQASKKGIHCYKEEFYKNKNLKLTVSELRGLIEDLYEAGYIKGIDYIKTIGSLSNDDLGYKITDDFRLSMYGKELLDEYNYDDEISQELIDYIPTFK